MNILQISAPKTGSFWINTILNKTLKIKGLPITYYIRNTAEYQKLKQADLSFKGQAGTDMLDIEEEGIFFRVSSLLKKPVDDLNLYSQTATLAWTHSTFCSKTPKVLSSFDRKVCIVRDPRDTALSAAKFAFTPYMKRRYPTSYTSAEEYLEGEYERMLQQWVWFYGNYLLRREEFDLHFVFYENLLNDFQAEYEAMLQYLSLKLTSKEKEEIEDAVSFNSMKEESPRHLQKGKSRKWVEKLSPEKIYRASEIAGPLMNILGYPLTSEAESPFPSAPKDIPERELESMLEKIDWHNLYE